MYPARRCAVDLEVGDVVCLDADLRWVKANADAAGLYPARGIVTLGAAAGRTPEVCEECEIGGYSGLAPFGPVYLSDATGGITQTAPAYAQVIGYALTATIIRFRLHEVPGVAEVKETADKLSKPVVVYSGGMPVAGYDTEAEALGAIEAGTGDTMINSAVAGGHTIANQQPTAATASNAQFTFSSKLRGADGNAMSITITAGGALTHTVSGLAMDITVNNGVTTVADLISYCQAQSDLYTRMSVAKNAGVSDSAAVVALAATQFSGGGIEVVETHGMVNAAVDPSVQAIITRDALGVTRPLGLNGGFQFVDAHAERGGGTIVDHPLPQWHVTDRNAAINLMCDGAWVTWYSTDFGELGNITPFEYMVLKQIPVSWAGIPDWFEGGESMTPAQLRAQILGSGGEMLSHTYSMDAAHTGIPDTSDPDVYESKDVWDYVAHNVGYPCRGGAHCGSNGYNTDYTSPGFGAIPNCQPSNLMGLYNRALSIAYREYDRVTKERYYAPMPVPSRLPSSATRQFDLTALSAANASALIDIVLGSLANSRGLAVSLWMHRVIADDDSTTPGIKVTAFKELIDKLALYRTMGLIEVVPFTKLHYLMPNYKANRLINPGFEYYGAALPAAITTWVLDASTYGAYYTPHYTYCGAGSSIQAIDTSGAPSSTGSTSSAEFTKAAGQAARLAWYHVPVEPGETYSLRWAEKCTQAGGGGEISYFHVFAQFYDRNGVALDTSAFPLRVIDMTNSLRWDAAYAYVAAGAEALNTWYYREATISAPTGAYTVRLTWDALDVTLSAAKVLLDDVFFG